MSTNLLIALLGGFGVFWLFVIPRINAQKQKSNLERVDDLMFPDKESRYEATGNFLKSLRRNGLNFTLTQANLDITPAAFVRTALIIAVAAVAGGFILINNLMASLFIGFGGLFLYVNWLYTRRDKKVLEYEESLADMCDRMAAGAQLKNEWTGAVIHAAKLAPDVLKADFEYVASQANMGVKDVRVAFAPILEKRKSYSLDMMVDIIDVWQTQGSTRPLSEILSPLSNTLREMSGERRMMESRISGARLQLMITSVIPWAMVVLLRSIMPGYRELFAQPVGTMLLIVAFCISAGGYWFGEKQVSVLRNAVNLYKS